MKEEKNITEWKQKNPKKKIIDDIIRYEPKFEKHKEDLFKRSHYDLHYLRWQCLKGLSDGNDKR